MGPAQLFSICYGVTAPFFYEVVSLVLIVTLQLGLPGQIRRGIDHKHRVQKRMW
jgi:hypothetical protein